MRKIFTVLICLLILLGCSKQETYYKTRKEMDGQTLGVLSGSTYDMPVKRIYQRSKYQEYSSTDEMVNALLEKKIEGFVIDKPTAIIYSKNTDGITYINESVVPGDCGFIFSEEKQDILEEFNEYIKQCQEDGYLEYLERKWITPNGLFQISDPYILRGNAGTIKAVTSIDTVPFSFVSNNEVKGYEVDLLNKFCYEKGYRLIIEQKSFGEIIDSVKSCEYDVGFASINITNDRKRQVSFSEPIYDNYGVFVVRAPSSIKKSEFETLADLDGHTLGILNGSIYEHSVKEKFNNPQTGSFPSRTIAIEALKNKEIDGYVIEEVYAINIEEQDSNLTYIREPIDDIEYAYVFSSKKDDVKEQFNEFVKESKKNGYIEYLTSKWFSGDGANARNNKVTLTGENGTLSVVTSNDSIPYEFTVDGEYHGFEVELFNQFCYEYGYNYVISSDTFNSSLISVASDKYDLTFNSIGITEDRKKKYSLSDPVYSCPGVVITRAVK